MPYTFMYIYAIHNKHTITHPGKQSICECVSVWLCLTRKKKRQYSFENGRFCAICGNSKKEAKKIRKTLLQTYAIVHDNAMLFTDTNTRRHTHCTLYILAVHSQPCSEPLMASTCERNNEHKHPAVQRLCASLMKITTLKLLENYSVVSNLASQ